MIIARSAVNIFMVHAILVKSKRCTLIVLRASVYVHPLFWNHTDFIFQQGRR